MCRHSPRGRMPLLCIVPPHLLRYIARHPALETSVVAEWAMHTLLLSERLRGERLGIGAIATYAATPAGTLRRTVYDAKHTETLPGTLVRGEGDAPVRDAAVNEAYDGAGATWDLYHQVYDRNSVDDRGLRLESTVHFGDRFDNAFWNGRQMVYGDGDGVIFERFTRCVEVIGHELTHGVTQYEADLAYQGQSGALNESMSDVFGVLVKQRLLGQTAEKADWLIGAGLLRPSVKGIALRSMKSPGTAYDDPRIGKDPQPAHMRDYVETRDDSGGVHINSGIPNRAFCLTALGLGGRAWERAGRIWYIALRDRLRSTATFADAARETVAVAGETFDAKTADVVRLAWKTVGVTAGAKARARATEDKVADRVHAQRRVRRNPRARRSG